MDMIETDVMHNVCLGSGAHLIGSGVAQLCLENHWPGTTRARKLVYATYALKAWRRKHHIDCRGTKRLTQAYLAWKWGAYPAIKSKAHKARVMFWMVARGGHQG